MREQILEILRKDARTSSEMIADLIGSDAETVAKEIAEMEEEGVIRRYKTIIDREKAGDERVFAFIDVRVSPTRGVGFDDVARRIYRYPEVHSVYLVSGDYDLRVVVEGETMKEVAFFVADKLSTLDGVLSTQSNFLLKKYKEDGDIFDDIEEDTGRLLIS
ncbi:MAG: Lrp/AsnC family transcriptional regulator [Abditibacteriota bacterium]|nr:Lrp/AsnC family transcriptional regulator [Abditibacteriota bacterium]MBP5093305.1 Lrp/AsnC family transcriptional regulator [Abditibacteriota bacterium]MBP5738478.1 Lrp/AsnC family transcriptional regulator [Abditibacteriota bacterium]